MFIDTQLIVSLTELSEYRTSDVNRDFGNHGSVTYGIVD
jgi:hypothetical protein